MGNIVGSLRQFSISQREKEIIIGTILGDGYLGRMKKLVRLEINHSKNQKDYVDWKYKELKKFVGANPHNISVFDKRYKKYYKQRRFKTRGHSFFSELYTQFYTENGRKVVPKNINKVLNSPLSLAVWFMDDGGRRNDSYGLFLNTLSFTKSEHNLLVKCLKKNFSLDVRIHWIQDGYRLYIPSHNSQRFCELVFPYLIPSMRYKLSYNPVTTSFACLDRARDRR